MKIALDIDGVLADFVTPFLQLLERRVGGPSIDPASITDPNFNHHPFLTRELIYDCMVDASYDPEFWRVLAPLPSVQQWRSLSQISRDNEVVFITHRWVRDTYDINHVTCQWLRDHGIDNPVVHFTQDLKSLLVKQMNVELFVDDRHENCQDVATQTEAVVMMPHRPYNRSFAHPRVQRIQDLDALFEYLGTEDCTAETLSAQRKELIT
ncbi:MAG TPA: hypothetical protein VFK65_11915 [Candidatus Binatia bacterium]|nr:hypothetical protein [Candidatus Binatia bacterium]